MSDLSKFFYDADHHICQKWEDYFPVYECHFGPFRQLRDVRLLEIGVSQGGSLDMWRHYFGHEAILVGIDIDENCKRFERDRTFIRIGSQEDRNFLGALAHEFGPFDIIIDDGGHFMRQQITSFETLYPTLTPRGVYLCEDCHTSYQEAFGGALRGPGTFIEFARAKFDELNGWHVHGGIAESITELTRTTVAISFYESIVVFEKCPRRMPRSIERGRQH